MAHTLTHSHIHKAHILSAHKDTARIADIIGRLIAILDAQPLKYVQSPAINELSAREHAGAPNVFHAGKLN